MPNDLLSLNLGQYGILRLDSFNLGPYGILRYNIDNAGKPWFCCADIARALDYNPDSRVDVLFSHVPDDWKGPKPFGTPGGTQQMLAVREEGLYFFLGRSDKPKALPYQMKVAGVLPALKRPGIIDSLSSAP